MQTALTDLGVAANQMATRLEAALHEYNQAVISAGNLISEQEAANTAAIGKAGEGDSSGLPDWLAGAGNMLSGNTARVPIPNGPNVNDIITSGMTSGLPPVPGGNPTAVGTFPCAAGPEPSAGLTLDACRDHLSSADQTILQTLSDQWKELSSGLENSVTVFHRIVQSNMQNGGWTGSSGPAVGAAAHRLVTTSAEISAQAAMNAGAILAWGGGLGATKSGIDGLSSTRSTAMATAPLESKAAVQNSYDSLARMQMDATYNPAVTAIAHGLSNLSDPGSPTSGVPITLFQTLNSTGSTGSSSVGTGGTTGSGSSGPSGGAGGGGGGSTSAGKATTDAAQGLTRQGTGDPVAAATKNAAGQAGQNNPASAAQSAMSKAGDATKSLGSKSGGASPLTRSAGLGGLSDAERSAAGKAAALAKGGGGAGGGAGGGGGGKIGGIGGAGAAAPEGSLSARSTGSALTAAERALAGQQGATAARPAGGMSPGMGARGAGSKGEDDKEHKAARYLVTTENGEEIAGDLPDTAPPVLGGLNLDTTDDTTR
ncbi:hypothetical protein [Williamsia sp. Leaf354]|uniref:hypothetical protein n=1 Tax=Williamsia sp. Leaf354 TaxID=1736349 RepID=UPI000B1A77CA|nr:hypothetical protein [Williamsia sp. Leaf354]